MELRELDTETLTRLANYWNASDSLRRRAQVELDRRRGVGLPERSRFFEGPGTDSSRLAAQDDPRGEADR